MIKSGLDIYSSGSKVPNLLGITRFSVSDKLQACLT